MNVCPKCKSVLVISATKCPFCGYDEIIIEDRTPVKPEDEIDWVR